jgi:molybdopterin-synthase adenylyltransferase
MSTVRLKPSVEPFPASSGDIYLLRSDGGDDVVLREADPFARELVAALAEGVRPAERPELRPAIAQLTEVGLLAQGAFDPGATELSPEEALRYDRQLHYFGDQATSESGAGEMQLALRNATVVVLGAGGLGSWTMAGLACAGVGRIVAVDDDTIELSNLNRQVLYRVSDIGRRKVDVAAEALRDFNPDIDLVPLARRIRGVADVRSVATGADFVVCTADWPVHDIGRWVNEACVELRIPHISAGQFPPRVRIGPTFVPGRTACLECEERAIRRDFPLYDELVEHRRTAAPVAATLGAPSGLIGSLLAMEVIHWITGISEPATLGRGLVFDLRDFSSHWESIEPDPGCQNGCVSTEGEQAANRFAHAVTSGDVEAGVALCHPEVEFNSVLGISGRAYLGHEGIRQYFDDVASAWREWRVEVEQVTEAADGRVAIVMTMHASGKGSGATLAERTGHIWTLRDGKLWHNEPYREPEEALQELGLMPPS